MIYKIFSNVFSTIGSKRKVNQDNYYLNGKILEDTHKAVSQQVDSSEEGIYAICDGMGGESDGEVASLIAVKELKEIHDVKQTDESVIRSVIDKANTKICSHITGKGKNSGSTFVAAVVKRKRADIYNIGDSRCYLIRKDSIRQLTKDHTLAAQMVESGMITEEEAKTDIRRHQLVQHLGIFPEEMTLSIHKNSVSLESGDILLLCSDGITDGLDDQEIIETVRHNDNAYTLAFELAENAMNNGSLDNITAMVINIQADRDEVMVRILYIIICICSAILGALSAIFNLLMF